MENTEKKLCILFPGVGYNTDRPLLYYSGKRMRQKGYEISCVSYHDLPEKIGSDSEKMKLAFEIALSQAVEQLKAIDLGQYSQILLIGKSIGTAVAAAAGEKLLLKNASYIYLTPLEITFRYAKESSGIAFHGTSDPWVETGIVKEGCERLSIPLHIYEGANHSLETGDILRDIDILKDCIEKL